LLVWLLYGVYMITLVALLTNLASTNPLTYHVRKHSHSESCVHLFSESTLSQNMLISARNDIQDAHVWLDTPGTSSKTQSLC
jgi:hypothetical protein